MGWLPHIGWPELVSVLVLALVFLGPGRLTEAGGALGHSIREFRRASQGLADRALPGVERWEPGPKSEPEPGHERSSTT